MNKCWANAAKRAVNRRRHARGQSAVELALVTPIMIVLLLVAADFGRVFYTSIAVNNAARARPAQYGSRERGHRRRFGWDGRRGEDRRMDRT